MASLARYVSRCLQCSMERTDATAKTPYSGLSLMHSDPHRAQSPKMCYSIWAAIVQVELHPIYATCRASESPGRMSPKTAQGLTSLRSKIYQAVVRYQSGHYMPKTTIKSNLRICWYSSP